MLEEVWDLTNDYPSSKDIEQVDILTKKKHKETKEAVSQNQELKSNNLMLNRGWREMTFSDKAWNQPCLIFSL